MSSFIASEMVLVLSHKGIYHPTWITSLYLTYREQVFPPFTFVSNQEKPILFATAWGGGQDRGGRPGLSTQGGGGRMMRAPIILGWFM